MSEIDKTESGAKEEKAGGLAGLRLGGLAKSMPQLGGIRRGGSRSSEKEAAPVEEIRKLSRTELLEMLIDETKEAERLRLDNERLQEENKRLRADLEKTASLDMVISRLQTIVDRAGH